MTGSFILDYYVLVVLASCGVFQMAAACNGFVGMLFLKYRPGSFSLGLALLIGSFTWFFLSEPRNVSDGAHGLNGNEQFAYFFAGSGTALTFTLLVTSLIYRKLGAGRSNLCAGLDALKQSVYLHGIYRTRRHLWPNKLERRRLIPGASIDRSMNHSETNLGKLRFWRRMISRLASQTRRISGFRQGTG